MVLTLANELCNLFVLTQDFLLGARSSLGLGGCQESDTRVMLVSP